MPPDDTTVSALPTWHRRMFGDGELPVPRFSFRLRAQAPTPTSLGGVDWAVRGFELRERVGEPYVLDLRLLASTTDIDIDALLGTRVELEIERGELARTVLGVVLAAELGGTHGQGALVRLHVGPALALLGFTRRSRAFQGRSVPQIIEDIVGPVLAERGGAIDASPLTRSYPPRDYCVQYRETDLDFVLRLLADVGIALLFHHEHEAETVVLVDANEALPPAGREPLAAGPDDFPPLLPLLSARADEAPVESLRSASQVSHTRRRQWHSVTWDWKSRPTTSLRSRKELDGGRATHGDGWDVDEHRPDEGQGTDGPIDDETALRTRTLGERDDAEAVVLRASSNATVLRAGSVFELAGPELEGYAESWVVTAVRHHADAPHASLHGSTTEARPEFVNDFEAQPLAAALRPAARPRPRVYGIHTAIVTGPEGEAIHTDRFGRVQVRMLWDDTSHDDEPTSCWLRVAQPWAGDGFGTVFIPRVGTEVLVTFVDGDPDRPLCTGGVYDGAAMPPYELPEHRSRTVLRTASLDGDGFNELSFEDGIGQQEVFLHARRDLRETVRGAHSTSVGASQRLAVGASRTTTIGKDDEVTIAGSHRRTVDGDVELHLRSGLRMHVSAAPKPAATKGVGVVVDEGLYEVDVKEGIEFRCGECSLRISPDTITLSGPRILAKSTGPFDREQSTLLLVGGQAELRGDQVFLDTGASRLLMDDRVMLEQGSTGAPKVGLDFRKGEAVLAAEICATVSTATLSLNADGPASWTAKAARIEAGQLQVETTGNIELDAADEVQVRGTNKIRLN